MILIRLFYGNAARSVLARTSKKREFRKSVSYTRNINTYLCRAPISIRFASLILMSCERRLNWKRDHFLFGLYLSSHRWICNNFRKSSRDSNKSQFRSSAFLGNNNWSLFEIFWSLEIACRFFLNLPAIQTLLLFDHSRRPCTQVDCCIYHCLALFHSRLWFHSLSALLATNQHCKDSSCKCRPLNHSIFKKLYSFDHSNLSPLPLCDLENPSGP